MPSTSPGLPTPRPQADFAQILPGAPTSSLQALATFTFRHKRYVAYISGQQLNICASPTKLIQALEFDDELIALTAESQTGTIAVACKSRVYVLEPVAEGWTRVWWEKKLRLRIEEAGDEARCLSWGNEGELLVGGSKYLSLFSTLPSSRAASPAISPVDGNDDTEERSALWYKPVASFVQYAAFCPLANLIATCGVYDRLVKIWRRLSFEEGLFDYTYLPHQGAVTHVEWRPLQEYAEERRGSGISGRHEENPELLYTIANDGLLRVWRTCGMHDQDIVILHTSIDLVSAIPQSPSLFANGSSDTQKPARYTFNIPAEHFQAAVAAAKGRLGTSKASHALEHLSEVSSKSPDVTVVMDGHGRMSAWGLHSIGHKRRSQTPGSEQAFHIAHAEDLPLKLDLDTNARFQVWFADSTFHILAHSFGGHVTWWQGDVEVFFSPSAAGQERLVRSADWNGHAHEVVGLQATDDGKGLGSRSATGEVNSWTLQADQSLIQLSKTEATTVGTGREGKDASTLPFASGVEKPSILEANDKFAALVSSDGLELTLIDLKDGYIEHKQTFKERVRYLSCYRTIHGHNLLAIAFGSDVEVFAQGRYDHQQEQETWTAISRLSISETGLHISAIEWMIGARLVIAAGNGVMVCKKVVDADGLDVKIQDRLDLGSDHGSVRIDVLELASQLNQPSPVWHPDTLSHLVGYGKPGAAVNLVHRLNERLKFWSEGDELDSHLGISHDELLVDDADDQLSGEAVQELIQQLEEKDLPLTSIDEQRRMRFVVKALAFVCEHARGLDSCALRYLFNWKLQLLLMTDEMPDKTSPNGVTNLLQALVPRMGWREIAFASHSTTQQPLLDILVLHYDNKLTWDMARSLGITAWVSDKEALAQAFEALAQSAYRQSNPPDPTNASLFFLALRRKQTLISLWRIATWHKEQRPTTNFLKRDFTLPECRTAAKKNAYALMGKRRFEYAAAFFLLADDAGSAVSLLAGQCGDAMLAIAVARLYSGDDSLTLRKLLDDRLLPTAQQDGDRWLMSWCHSTLGRKQEAADALVEPLQGVRRWHQDDPLGVVLYQQLRQTPSEHEYQAVLRAARVLRRMGMWLLAMDFVSSWTFKPAVRVELVEPGIETPTNGVHHEVPSMLEDFAAPEQPMALPVEPQDTAPPVMDEKAARHAEAAELMAKMKAKKEAAPVVNEKAQPTQFKEPDPSSLLDNFGF
ncbi:regulator of (H+)-ATPase in vacuolar membrane [Elasticomyces elasticus]|uniref:Regulator of (H+)-ATPase in vacuolar membrane n=1 Tax=Elasticomyces elasticus TaxID=574655 RepID=A0AAN7WG37_9PEZI|nr:regulator of (H+)-ATPase in vacuolar membrane [Elasticomyces elasticus]